MTTIPSHPKDVSAEWLTEALRGQGCLAPDASVTDVQYQIFGTGKMGDNARFTLSYSGASGDAPNTLVGKFPAEDETARAMAGARGAYYAEVMFYRHLADRSTMRTPTIFANEISEDKQLFVTLMEDLAPSEPGDQIIGENRDRALAAVKEAAKLAASFYGDKSIVDADYVMSNARADGGAMGQDLLQQFWPVFLDRFGDSIDESCRAFGDLYVQNHMRFVQRYKGPTTLAHADFRSENILFNGAQLCTVDWQTVSELSPLADVAYFMGGSVEIEHRRAWEKELVEEYREELAAQGVALSADDCWEQYREQSMHGLMITILGACFSEAGERSDLMFTKMIQRHLQHCVDLDAAALLKG